MRWVVVLWALLWPGLAAAQELSALARLVPGQSALTDRAGEVVVDLALTQAVPWRVRVLDQPPRLVLDMREVDWAGLGSVTQSSAAVVDMRAGMVRQGWSRLVLELAGPHLVAEAEMDTADSGADSRADSGAASGAVSGARVRVRLQAVPQDAFAAQAAQPEPAEWALPSVADLPKPALRGAGPVVVVLDPGHGGIDPGAEREGLTEAGLMLTFARELKEVLVRDGGFSVVMTRDEDVFVPLETRITIARAAGAHVFVSLHADAIAEGEAVGATIFTLSDEASDAASQALAERHDRDDLLAGVDLTAQDDLVAAVLMDMARTETAPRIDRLARALQSAIKAEGLRMHRHPRQTAGFSVLKSPDIPSVLVELGFMSSAQDLARLTDAAWRARMALSLRDGLAAWAREDAAIQALPR
jgi:N-acetylmuramoyl-L-alanine amidase